MTRYASHADCGRVSPASESLPWDCTSRSLLYKHEKKITERLFSETEWTPLQTCVGGSRHLSRSGWPFQGRWCTTWSSPCLTDDEQLLILKEDKPTTDSCVPQSQGTDWLNEKTLGEKTVKIMNFDLNQLQNEFWCTGFFKNNLLLLNVWTSIKRVTLLLFVFFVLNCIGWLYQDYSSYTKTMLPTRKSSIQSDHTISWLS